MCRGPRLEKRDLALTGKSKRPSFEVSGPSAEARLDFSNMKRLGVFLLHLGWDASPLPGLPTAVNSSIPIYTPGWREALWSKVSCPRTQRNYPCQVSNPDRSIRSPVY